MVDVKFECKLVLPFKKIIEKRLKEDAEELALQALEEELQDGDDLRWDGESDK